MQIMIKSMEFFSFYLFVILDEPVHDALKEWTKRVREFYEGNVNLSTKQFFSALDDFAQVRLFLNLP